MQRSKIKDQNYKSKFKNFAIYIVILIFTFYILNLFPTPVYAVDPPCDNAASIAAGRGPCPAGLDQLQQTVGNIISVIVMLGFIAMFILVLWAGIKYLTSGGEPKAIQAAHHTLTWAILGLFFMVIAWLILQLIAGFTDIDLTVFNAKILCKVGGNDFCKPGP